MITKFEGQYRWLSNFAPVPIKTEVREYPSVEHAFMAFKSHDENWRDKCANGGYPPGQIKKMGRRVRLREDWEEIKLQVMEDCLREKFSRTPFRERLLATGDEYIQEGNYWNDKYWGVCLKTGEGKNHLGRLIMQIREEIV